MKQTNKNRTKQNRNFFWKQKPFWNVAHASFAFIYIIVLWIFNFDLTLLKIIFFFKILLHTTHTHTRNHTNAFCLYYTFWHCFFSENNLFLFSLIYSNQNFETKRHTMTIRSNHFPFTCDSVNNTEFFDFWTVPQAQPAAPATATEHSNGKQPTPQPVPTSIPGSIQDYKGKIYTRYQLHFISN